MADKRISQLVERTDIANNDVVPIVASGATTTNKATISSIQEFMQENLDLGVTSVGITLGTTGTDVSVTGSPITTSGNITINIPSASATARGLVTTGTQTFAGAKTFSNTLSTSTDAFINGVNIGKGGSSITTNTRLGVAALGANTIGVANTSIGFGSAQFNTTGSNNTSLGTYSLLNNTTGASNTSVGSNAGIQNTSGDGNTMVGVSSMQNNTTGRLNVSVGFSSLQENTTGSFNIALGDDAGRFFSGSGNLNTITNNSIYIGSQTRALANNQTNQIVIGHNAIGQGSNTVTIGNSSITSNKLFGRVIHADAVNADESATLGQVNTSLDGYVTLNTAQNITAPKGFINSGGGTCVTLNHTSGSGVALDIIKAGNNEAIRVTKTSGSGNAVTITGGLLSAEAATLTGALNGTSASFTGGVNLATSSGNVGIGTASPSTILDVLSVTPTLTLRDSRTGGAWSAGIELGKLDFFTSDTTGIGAHSIASIGVIAGGANTVSPDGVMVFSTGLYNTAPTEKMRITSTGNVGIGTASPQTTLDVNGATSIFRGQIAFTGSDGIANGMSLNYVDGASANSVLNIRDNANSANRVTFLQSGNVGIGTATPATRLHIVGGGTTTSASDFATTVTQRIDVANAAISLGFGYVANDFAMIQSINNATSTARTITINPFGGNVLIGTPTDGGFRLDVNGTARVSGAATFSNTIAATSATLSGDLTLTGTGGHTINMVATTAGSQTISMTASGGGSNTVTGTGGDFNIQTTNAHPLVYKTNNTERMRITSTGNVGIGTATPNASSQLDITSTTQGFLPPRMTSTQKTTIATPATGLVVYDTTLNKLSVYTGAAWETVTSL
jgi:hypothetical protein